MCSLISQYPKALIYWLNFEALGSTTKFYHLKPWHDLINLHLLLRESWVRWTTKSPLPSPFTGGGGLKGRKGETSFPLKITFSQWRSRVKESFYENRSIYLLFWGNCLVEMKKLAVRHLWRNWPNSSSDCRSQAGKEERMVFGKKKYFPPSKRNGVE